MAMSAKNKNNYKQLLLKSIFPSAQKLKGRKEFLEPHYDYLLM